MKDWNVVATARESRFPQAIQLLKPFGRIERTHYYDVLVMQVADPRDFLKQVHARLEEDPALAECIGHVSPCTETFTLQSPESFEAAVREIALGYVPDLAYKWFHVRMHRRGFKGQLHATDEEQFLDGVLLEALENAGTPGEISFDDPDAIIAIETIDAQGGIALWTRDDLQKYPLLNLD